MNQLLEMGVGTASHETEDRSRFVSRRELEFLDPRQVQGWDALVERMPQSHFFLSSAWADVLADSYEYVPCYAVIRSGSQLNAVLPLMEVASSLTGKRGVSLPFTDSCPPLLVDAAVYESLFKDVIDFGTKRGWRYIELRGAGPPQNSVQPSTWYWEHVIQLVPEKEAFNRLKSEVRTAIRRAEREHVRVEIQQSRDAMDAYYRLHCGTRSKHGLPPQPFAFFENIWRHVIREKKGDVFLAWHDDQVVAGAVFFRFGKRVIYKFGASQERFQQLRANNLIFWEAMRYYYQQQGFGELSLGRTSPSEEGLRRFKLGWGAEERRINYYRYEIGRKVFVSAKQRETGWHNAVFRAVPQPVSRAVGALLYKHTG